MYVKVTTTIVTEIDIDTMTVVKHDVNIHAEDGIPEALARAAALGAARTLVENLSEGGRP